MIGNDLVDLQQAATESNWQRRGYLDKLFLPEEQRLILADTDPQVMLWMLWTMKEASYKALNRINGIRTFRPTSFCCHNLLRDGAWARAIVSNGASCFFIKTELTEQMVHSVACINEEALQNPNIYIFENVPDYTAAFHSASDGNYLTKTDGLPLITDSSSGATFYASLSHHGKFTAITYTDSLRSVS